MAAITKWREKGKSLYNAVLILSLMPLVDGVLSIYDKLDNLGSIISMMEGGDVDALGVSSSDFVIPMLMAFAYIMYFTGLTGFAKLQTEEDAHSVLRIRSGAVWGLVAQALSFVPVGGWLLSFVASVISFFIMISGYSRLRNSYTFPVEARRGAGRLKAAMIWSVIAAILHIIPLLGPVLAGIINFILFFVVLSGWSRIKDAVPLTTAGRTIIDRLKLSDAPNGALIAWGIVLSTAVVSIGQLLFFKVIFPHYQVEACWDVYNYSFYFVYCLGLFLFLLGVVALYKRNVAQRKGFTILLVAAGVWLAAWLIEFFLVYAFKKWQLETYEMYRVVNVLIIIACILFVVGFQKLASIYPDRFMREGANVLIGFYLLIVFQQLFVLEVIYIGEFRTVYDEFYPLVPWLCLYLGVVGWRSILSALYGKGEIVPTDDLLSNSPSNCRASSQTWIPQSSESDGQEMKRREALCEKVLLKTDDELNQILADSEEYKPELVDAAREEKARREQETEIAVAEKVRKENEMLRYAPKNVGVEDNVKVEKNEIEE